MRRRKAAKPRNYGGFRSTMEQKLVPALLERGAEYEPVTLGYPGAPRRYIPDVALPNGIALEIKGWFKPADRSKMIAVKEAYPGLDIRMVLASPNKTLNKGSKTTEAQWCEKHGFPFAVNEVPEAWLAEPFNEASFNILNSAPRRKKKAS